MTALGIVIGLWVKTEAVQGVNTLLLLGLSLLGGLWFPAEMMPSGMQHVAHASADVLAGGCSVAIRSCRARHFRGPASGCSSPGRWG